MKLNRLFATSILLGSSVLVAQSAMAYGQGDVFFRADAVKTDMTANDKYDGENTWSGAIGVMPFDQLGVELSGTDKDTYTTNTGDSFEMAQYSLMAQYYPLGGTDARVQPYAGLGATYFDFGDSSLLNGTRSFESKQWAPTAQAGVDLMITDNWAVNGYAQYSDLDVDYNQGNERKLNPVTVGGGVSFRF
ncbi:OmpW/AlkL family protein [Kushneria aurantia]|uniref:OmpW family protein n=1 Tax=Kushneria aurantia TaxID=504092 RepID=A0ABV6G1U2_9GAMM|nr:OmpW family outer membrane protein [Kushneria aurantia]